MSRITGALALAGKVTLGAAGVTGIAFGAASIARNHHEDSPAPDTSGGGKVPPTPPPAHDERRPKIVDHDGPRPRNDIRIITIPHLKAMRTSGASAETERLFNNDHTYVSSFKGHREWPKGWKSHEAMLFDSYEDFAKQVKRGIPKVVDAVIYDNEEWERTPLVERNNADTYARKFGNLAHKHGLEYIAAPAPTGPGSRLFEADAQYADILVIQAQGAQAHPRAYRGIIEASARAAHRVNPDVKIVSEISSNPHKLDGHGIGGNANHQDVRIAVSHITGPKSHRSDGFWPWTYISSKNGMRLGEDMVRMLDARLPQQ